MARYGQHRNSDTFPAGMTPLRNAFEKRENEQIQKIHLNKKTGRTNRVGSEPSEDTRVSGGKIARIGGGGPTIYYEKSGGRRGGKGKRV